MRAVNIYDGVEDSALVDQLGKGDWKAFNAIYSRYAGLLHNYAFNILMDEDECTDVVQDIFVWLWENREKLNINHLKGYLLAAVKYKLTRHIVSSKRKADILKAVPPPAEHFVEENIEIKELRAAIHDFIGTLPPQARKIFRMSREQYLSNKEIGLELGLSEKTVRNQMTITLKKLKVYLGRLSFWTNML
ncbi:RNA polymerase sigma-70 factor [Chitinophaga deserti]|uniref:RNA polymerase sigma-70 factor n=1 Tax=Chitinophaga deserti TaxID=2164099 RepID=UPI000D6AB375|nr:RNA polymerase sigma-70 factor [Chitinophaga deserti]